MPMLWDLIWWTTASSWRRVDSSKSTISPSPFVTRLKADRRERTPHLKSGGCSAFEGGSSDGGDDPGGVARGVYPLLLLGEVVGPVVVEVAVAAQGTELEDRLGTGQAPAGAGEVHPILDQVPAGTLDDAGGDRPASLERGRVVQVGTLAGQVVGAGV